MLPMGDVRDGGRMCMALQLRRSEIVSSMAEGLWRCCASRFNFFIMFSRYSIINVLCFKGKAEREEGRGRERERERERGRGTERVRG